MSKKLNNKFHDMRMICEVAINEGENKRGDAWSNGQIPPPPRYIRAALKAFRGLFIMSENVNNLEVVIDGESKRS